MRKLKIYVYDADGFVRGQFTTYAPHRVRRYLRKMLGFKLYWKLRKNITISEVKENVE